MTRRFSTLMTASLVATLCAAQSNYVLSREQQRHVICFQPIPTTCPSVVSEAAGPAPTCCQPAAATISASSSPIELCAHTQPAPRRLTPEPDALEINPTFATTYCAIYMYLDHGTY